MLRTIIISPDAGIAERLGGTLAGFDGAVQLCRIIDRYPDSVEMSRMLRAHAPEVIFLSFENLPQATTTVRFLESQSAGLQIIAINSVCDATHLRESMRVGLREFLTDPFDSDSVSDALRNINALLQKKPPGL